MSVLTWIFINTINMLITLTEIKSEDQWQSEPIKSSFYPQKVLTFCSSPVEKKYKADEQNGIFQVI